MPLLALMATTLLAADPSGDWKGSFSYQDADVPVTFHLKVQDANLSGTIEGLPTSPATIADGKVDGDTITFNTTINYQGNEVKLVLKGKVENDQINFSMGTEDGSFGVNFVAKRAA